MEYVLPPKNPVNSGENFRYITSGLGRTLSCLCARDQLHGQAPAPARTILASPTFGRLVLPILPRRLGKGGFGRVGCLAHQQREKGDVVPACTAPRGVPPRYPILGGRASGHALLVSVLRDQPLGNARGSSPAKLAARCVKRDSAPGCPTRGDIIMCHTADQQPHACSETVCNGQSPDRLGVSWQRGTSILAWQWTFPRSLARPLPESACPVHPQAAQGRPSKTGKAALGGVAGTESLNFQPSALSTNP